MPKTRNNTPLNARHFPLARVSLNNDPKARVEDNVIIIKNKFLVANT